MSNILSHKNLLFKNKKIINILNMIALIDQKGKENL